MYYGHKPRLKKLTEQVARALWIGSDLPQEYIEFGMCRVYKCLPSELDNECWDTIRKHLAFLAAEEKARK